jgi:hypothetical protein
MTHERRSWVFWSWALGLSLALSCATSGTQKAGGTPPSDPRGVPIGGTPAGYQSHAVPNFYDATSVGSPGSGAFAGSGPGALEQHREQMTGQPAPKTIPEIPPPQAAAPVVIEPVAPSATPVEATPAPPRPPEEPIFPPPGEPQPEH